MTNDKAKTQLSDIINIARDGQLGYQRAADNMDNAEIKTIFNRLSQQRASFIEELKHDARDLGLDMDERSTVQGFFHRNWMDLKANFASKEDEVIIEEAQTGEQTALKTYNEAINSHDLPSYIEEKVEKQRSLIEGAITQLEEFKASV